MATRRIEHAPFVIVGGGLASARAAQALREEGAKGRIVLLTAEDDRPYHRPPLSKDFLRGETPKQDLFVHSPAWWKEHDVEVVNGDEAVRIEGAGHGAKAVRVVTKGGRTLECDLVVAGVGAAPRTDLAAGTPVQVGNGVLTDEYLQTSQPGIYAAGDIACFYSPLYGRRLRVEHWDVADKHGLVAGRNMARDAAGHPERREAFDEPPYFFSDLFDLAMEYLGHNEGWDATVVRGDPEGDSFTACYLRGARLVAALFVNHTQDVDPTRALIQRRLQVDDATRQSLADLQVDLGALAR